MNIDLKGVDFDRLTAAVEWSSKQLENPRKNRLDAIRQFVGKHYADNGSDHVVPTNYLELAVTIYTRLLAARAPRATFNALNSSLKPFAKTTELALNQIPDEIGLGETLAECVLEALFSFAVVKLGLRAGKRRVDGIDPGEPYAETVSIDDYFCDMNAKKRSAIQFEGNDYWMILDDVLATYKISKEDISYDDPEVTGENGEPRAEGISTDEGGDVYSDRIKLRDVWLPRERLMVTYAVKSKTLLNVADWDGPEHSPYHVLGYSPVPGNLLPLPPIALWMDMHELANNIFRKLGKQATDKKTVVAFSGNDDEGPNTLRAASDGEGIKYNGTKPENITVGGIDQQSLAFGLVVGDKFSYFAGNLDSLGGLGPSTDTVGQDKLINEAASARLQGMTDRTLKFVKDIFKALAWYEWTDPIRVRNVNKSVPGTDIGVPVKWSPETREGDFLDFNFDIDVYSMQDDSPSSKLQKIGLVFERFIVPLLPNLEQQGIVVDGKGFLSVISKLSNLPEINDILMFSDGGLEQNPVSGNANPVNKPAKTTREYIRTNRPGATRSGKENVMAQLLMGGKSQPSEMDALTRGVT
ncbi:MAG: hypothetical protein R6V06_00050 [Kiritimatiellia bacterium]